MSRMASPGSLLPGGFILGALSHADRIGLVYEAFPAEGRGVKARALVLHPLHVEELREWFERTAVLGRGLKHTNLVEVHALGYTANQLPVMITEWTDGRTLRSRIASGEVIPVPEVRRIIDETAAALDYLHERSPPVLHRVVMPETVLVPPDGQPIKLLAVGHADRPQHPASKVNYLSPEEIAGGVELTPGADLFSLASLAFETLTGRPAFPGNSGSAVLNAVQRRALPYIALAPQEGLEPLDAIFHRAWSMDPARRPASATEFAHEFATALASVPSTLLTSRRTVREGVLRGGTIPPVHGPGSRNGTMRFATPVPGQSRNSARPPALVAKSNVVRSITPLLGGPSGHASPRGGTAPGHTGIPARIAELPAAQRRVDDDAAANSWLTLDGAERDTYNPPPSPPGEADAQTTHPVVTPIHGPLDVGDAVISSAMVDIDDPDVLELLSEDFTSPAIPVQIARTVASKPAPFEGDFAEQATPMPPAHLPTRPPPAGPSVRPRPSGPVPIRYPTQPAGFPTAIQRALTSPAVRAERPQEFDRSPVAPAPPKDERLAVEDPSAWYARDVRLTPVSIAVILALNLVLTGALVVVLRYLLG